MTPKESNETDTSSDSKKQVRIHTMPDKFYIEETGDSGKRGTLIFLLIGVLFLVLVGVGAFVLVSKFGNQASTNENANAVVNDGGENGNANTEGNSNAGENTNEAGNENGNANTSDPENVNDVIANIFVNFNTNTSPANNNTNTLLNVNTVSSSEDSDLDGLTDVEESLYGTSQLNENSDGDDYSDGHEVVNGYNPNGSGPLENFSTVRRFTNDTQGYSLLHPAGWQIADDPINEDGKMFSATNGEFVEVTVESNPARLSARDWYITMAQGVASSQVLSVTNWDKSLDGVLSADGMTVYYTRADRVYVINYSTTVLSEASYSTTFEMMYKSFKPAAITQLTNTNTNANSNTNSALNTNTGLNFNFNFNTNASNTNANTNTNSNQNTNTASNLNANSNSNTNTGS